MSIPRFLADENLNGPLIRAIQQHAPQVDLLRVQDAGRCGIPDSEVLAWAADEGRIVLSHDARTMPAAAGVRIRAGQAMLGVIITRERAPRRIVVRDLIIIVEASHADEYVDRVVRIPFDRATRVSECGPPEWAHGHEMVTSLRS